MKKFFSEAQPQSFPPTEQLPDPGPPGEPYVTILLPRFTDAVKTHSHSASDCSQLLLTLRADARGRLFFGGKRRLLRIPVVAVKMSENVGTRPQIGSIHPEFPCSR